MKTGIYLLANDKVYDQLVALLNSIEANYGRDVPVCIIPFDDHMSLVVQEIAQRKNIFLFEDKTSMNRWEEFIASVHEIYRNYPHKGVIDKKTLGLRMYRKCCAFDGPFDKFIYIDVDTLVFQSLDHIFHQLDSYDCVSHDFQRKTSIRKKEVAHFFEIFKDEYKSEELLSHQFHCGGFWASNQGAINDKDFNYFLQELRNGDIKVFGNSFLDDTPILNYMNLKKGLKLYNFTLDESSEYCTGVCITSPHFEEKAHILYDQNKKLTYLHYMGLDNERLRRLCQWQQMNLPYKDRLVYFIDKLLKWQIGSIPYKEIFLHYRFMDQGGQAG